MTKQILYHDNGNKSEESFYKDGKREGKCITYHENGEIELVGYFKKGKPCNVWICWDKNGYHDWVDMDALA